MTWVVDSSGTKTATGSGTEDTLATVTTVGEYVLAVDTNAMVNGDLTRIKVYDRVDGTNYRLAYEAAYQHVQICTAKLSPQIPITSGIKVSITQDAGTGRDYPWVLRRQSQVDVSAINAVSTSSVTTVNANVGTTQPINFTGTGASALAKSDMVDVAGAAVSTSTAQIGVNTVNAGGTAWGSGAITAASIAAAALNGKGDWNVGKTGYSLTQTFPTNFSSLSIDAGGVVKSNLAQILGTALTETAGQIAAAFKQFFNIASPTSTMNTITTVTTATTATNLTNAPTAGDFTATMKTSLNNATPAVTVSDKTGFSLSSGGVQAIWDALTSALTTVGSIGKLLVTNIDATISSRLASASISLSGGAVTVGTNNDKTGYTASTVSDKTGYALTSAYDFAKGTVAMTESYAANGVAPTPVQAIMAIHQDLMDFSISGTVYTVKKLDNATTAFAVTLDSATTPTAASRS